MDPNMSIVLDDYEAVNLLSAIRAIMLWETPWENPNNPLCALNSGDWVGQLEYKLEQRLQLPPRGVKGSIEFHSNHYGLMYPNRTPEQYVKEAQRFVELNMRSKDPNADKG